MRCPVLPPEPSWRPNRAELRIIQEALTPVADAFNTLFPEDVRKHPAVRALIQADEPLLNVWGDGSVSVASDAMLPLLVSLKKRAESAPQAPAQRSGILKRAAAYLNKVPPAISGQGGHAATFDAALKILSGFDLTPDEALDVMLERFNPRCEPPWSKAELKSKVKNAAAHLRAGK